MSIHYVGDMVASYTDSALTKIEIGWITEVVYESIWVAHVEHRQPAYKVQWAFSNEVSTFLHNESDIQDMKDLYEEWHKEKRKT